MKDLSRNGASKLLFGKSLLVPGPELMGEVVPSQFGPGPLKVSLESIPRRLDELLKTLRNIGDSWFYDVPPSKCFYYFMQASYAGNEYRAFVLVGPKRMSALRSRTVRQDHGVRRPKIISKLRLRDEARPPNYTLCHTKTLHKVLIGRLRLVKLTSDDEMPFRRDVGEDLGPGSKEEVQALVGAH
jgi:hypothetical protein